MPRRVRPGHRTAPLIGAVCRKQHSGRGSRRFYARSTAH